MTATTDNGASAKKSFFLTLEHCKIGDTRPLSEVLNNLRFNDQGLIPAVAQDSETGEVLMLAWMNSVAVKATLDTGQATYFSRSRNELWVKGKTSGHIQQVVELRIDCDGDALLCLVNQRGSACHTNRRSCFYLATDLQTETVHVTN